ncbi:MAG: hypothetical protein HYU97_00375 [Deltaproteobacteria bacterium]|nr:hypothetical protein [Deltaproteobacteria bacterium]
MKKKLFLLGLSLFLLGGTIACTEAEQQVTPPDDHDQQKVDNNAPDGNVNVLPPGVKPEDAGPSTESEDPLLNL